jgi:hypothetical protein
MRGPASVVVRIGDSLRIASQRGSGRIRLVAWRIRSISRSLGVDEAGASSAIHAATWRSSGP